MKLFYICLLITLAGLTGCVIKPDGGFAWYTPPTTTTGDGLSYETAYQLHHVDAGYLVTAEIEFLRDKYWVTPERAYEDFYHVVPPATVSCHDSMKWTREVRSGKAYDIITFILPDGQRTLYFDVTKQTKDH